MRDVARLGFVIVGIYVGLGGLVSAFTSAAAEVRGDPDSTGFVLLAFLGWVCLGLLPCAYLLLRSRSLSLRLFPEEPQGSLDTRALITAFVCVLGVYLVIRGVAETASQLMLLVATAKMSPEFIGMPFGRLVGALLLALAGGVLAIRARTVASFVYRTDA